jgi:hypothetical protein
MGVPTSEVGYTSATTGRGDHEVHKGHVVALERKKIITDNPSTLQLVKLRLLRDTGITAHVDFFLVVRFLTYFSCYAVTLRPTPTGGQTYKTSARASLSYPLRNNF